MHDGPGSFPIRGCGDGAHGRLVALAIEGSGPTIRLAGHAILDNSTREALLVLGRITAITADRRK